MDRDESIDHSFRLASWSCSCAPVPLYYCSVCVLEHITREKAKQHTVTQLSTSDRSRTCSRCKSTSQGSDAITIEAQSVHLSGNRISISSDLPDLGEGRDLRSEMLSLRTDITQHMNQVLEGLSVFDEARRRAAPSDLRLRETEQLLDETRQEVEVLTQEKIRLQQMTLGSSTSRTDAGQSPALEGLLEVIKNKETECVRLAHEVRELSQQNRSLVTEVSGLSAQLRHSSTGGQVISSGGLTAEEVAICTAQKVSEIMPILTDMNVSNEWLTSKGLEGFLSLSELAVQDPEKAPSARKIAKVCIRICQLVGHCKAMSGLGRYMRLRLERDMPGCLMLINYLKKTYQRTYEDPASKELFREIMGRLQNNIPEFDAAVGLIAHFSEALPAESLSHFSKALLSYLEEPDETTSKWLSYLKQVPVDWAPEIRSEALESIKSLLFASAERRFPRACLYLIELLISNQVENSKSLIAFIYHCCEALKGGNRHVYSLIFKLHGLVQENEELIEPAMNAMQQFGGARATIEEVALLMCALESIISGQYGALAWLYSDWGNAGEALGLLGLMLETETLEEATHSAEQLFTALASTLTSAETAICIKFMHRLFRSKPKHRDGLLFSLTSLVKTPLASFFLKDLTALPEEGASPEMLKDTDKLLNLVRKYPMEDIVTTGKYLASLICMLRAEGVTAPIVSKELKFVLRQRTEHLKRLSSALKPMVKSEPASAPLAVTLLSLLPKVPDETVYLMLFVPDMVMYLASTPMMASESVISFCENVLVKCFKERNFTLLRILKSQLQDSKLLPLADLVRRSKSPISILDVYELNLLPNVKADCIQVFDCMRNESISVVLKQPVKVDTSSSFVFVDNGSIFCCGGEL